MNGLISKAVFAIGLLLIVLPVRSDGSDLVKITEDHRVKVTLLYAGRKAHHSVQFAVVCLLEDGQDSRNAGGTVVCRGVTVKDGHYIRRGNLSSLRFSELAASKFSQNFPTVKMPDVENPLSARVCTAYFALAPTSPFDVSVWAVGKGLSNNERQGSVVFSGITSTTFPSN